ncbi:hypothetical protein BD410DRAFT_739414 [Rickenella mellea]|uniref:RING-type domain-containing protein n=1 Tax=Rickenella mellea TaxID=50990 RepID=A0A4Y7QLE0_9AGAM|nr:hypothetical protein BD410DRAFT_739414 [Rickenella mellea]
MSVTAQASIRDKHSSTPKRSKMAASQSLNHLLNFTLPPRQTTTPMSIPRRSKKTVTHSSAWNNEKFVNAQYRFVMKPTGDYTVHFADPDIYFQWQDILQVIIPRGSVHATADDPDIISTPAEAHTTCPICLSPPSAPRMTKCGHVFCFPCILHYLEISDRSKCPMCFVSVDAKQLKSVKWFDEHASPFDGVRNSSTALQFPASGIVPGAKTPPAGSILHMRLMQRPQITTLALPRSQTWPSDVIPPHQAPFYFLPDVLRFAKFMLATPDQLISDLSNDLEELDIEKRTLLNGNDILGITFIEAAESKVRGQLAKAVAMESDFVNEAIGKAKKELRDTGLRHDRDEQRRRQVETASPPNEVADIPDALLATQSIGFSSKAIPLKPQPTLIRTPRPRRNLNPPPPSTSTYYYYQAASGAPIFLHPLDIRILLAHFSEYASFPSTIAIRVEAASEGSVDDDLRKRCKYLAHMPEAADVVFVEADLTGVVGTEGLRNFEGALKMRRTRRREKGRKDDRARARADLRARDREFEVTSDVPADTGWIPSPVDLEPAADAQVEPVSTTPAGAWGTRSFASALHSAPSSGGPRVQGRNSPLVRREEEDEWDMDAAWHELERPSGARKKRGNKLVVLGGQGGRRR